VSRWGRRAGALAASVLFSSVLGSCAGSSAPVTCRNTKVLILSAQSVPSASLLPCVQSLPAGWTYGVVDIRSGRTRFSLDSDRAGVGALDVRLVARCSTEGATEIPTDEAGTRRFERIETVTPGFAATRYYTFTGGCVTYRLRLKKEGRVLVNEASFALTFLPRQAVADDVRRITDGRYRL
jgi:hypothetical protein